MTDSNAKQRRRILVGIIGAMLALAPDTVGAQEVGLFFDLETLTTSIESPTGGLVEAYLVAFDVPEGVKGFSVLISASTATSIVGTTCPPANPCTNVDTPENMLVFFDQCNASSGPIHLATVLLDVAEGAVDGVVCVGSHVPYVGFPPLPEVLPCGAAAGIDANLATRDPQSNYGPGCAVVNPTSDPPVGSATITWGHVKTRYRR